MKRLYSILIFFSLAQCLCHAQTSSAPPYRGPLDASVSVPANYRGQNYKITGDRLGGNGIDTAYLDSLNALNDLQVVTDRGNETQNAIVITGNDAIVSGIGLGFWFDTGFNTGNISQLNGLSGPGASITLGNSYWAITNPSGTMELATATVGPDSRFEFTHRVKGEAAELPDEFVTLQQLTDSLQPNNDTATVTVIGGIGTVEPVIANNGYGVVRWTNSTGSPAGEGLHIKVTYSNAYQSYAVPVMSPYVVATTSVPMSIATPVLASFEVEIGADIPAGETIGFTYFVKGQ